MASHGYVVAAADHTGNSFVDYAHRAAAGSTLTAAERDAYVRGIIADRVPDLCFLTDHLLAGGAGDVSDQIDDRRIGLVGWSFGGWAVLAAPEADDRYGALVALAPAGSSTPLPGIIPATLAFAWKRDVPTLLLAAERDRFTPLSGVVELFERTPSRRQMFVLRHADHDHFGDHIEVALCPREHAHLFTRGLALAHVDATLKENPAAQEYLAHDPAADLRNRGLSATAYRDAGPA